MRRLADTLKIRPGEGRLAGLVIALMMATSAGTSLGSTGIDALFYARFGVEFLPYMYVALGLVTFFNLTLVSGLLGRIARDRLFLLLPLALALILFIERLILALNIQGFYPVLWLSRDGLNALQGLFAWGLAGAVCDTRQAKRLFPLFTAGSITGGLIGAFATPPLVRLLHTENLLLVWSAALVVAFALSRQLVRRMPAAARGVRRAVGQVHASRHKRAGFLEEIQQGWRFVRRSPLMRWMSVMAILFSILWFSLLLPFSRAAAAQFPDADGLASFLATYQGLVTAVALLASLFLANRLFARFGVINMLLVYPAIYLAGFSVLAFFAAFPVIVIARFVKLVWSQGMAESAWQAAFNVVPPERRDQTWAFLSGVPGQAGIVIAGVILVIGEQTLQPQQLYFIGWAAAAGTILAIWRARRAYAASLVDALRAGQPQVFFSEEEPFGGFQRDAAAVAAAVAGLSDKDPGVRRVSAEILGNLSLPEAAAALLAALDDPQPAVRSAVIRALGQARASAALLDVAARLGDPEPEVRLQAVHTVQALAPGSLEVGAQIEPLLDDPEPAVKAAAAVGLLRRGRHVRAQAVLTAMASDANPESRLSAVTALGDWGAPEAFDLVAACLRATADAAPVRSAAAAALTRIDAERAVEPLMEALADRDRAVRGAAAQAMGRLPESGAALIRVMGALDEGQRSNPHLELGALAALRYLPVRRASAALREYAVQQAGRAGHYHAVRKSLPDGGAEPRLALLADSLIARAQYHGLNMLRALALLGDRAAIDLAIENLRSRNPIQHANALETVETTSESEIVRPVLAVWERVEPGAPAQEEGGLAELLLVLLEDPDEWLRACAALAAAGPDDARLRARLTALAETDSAQLVRETAAAVLKGASAMDTLPTLSLMERILFLRRVPLFADLPPADLKQIAAIASEHFYPEGEIISAQGEPGNELFIIISGEVRVVAEADGRPDQELARRKPGEYVGEMAIISQEPRMASLAAGSDTRTLSIDRKGFEGILRERPETSLAVMRVLCARLKEASRSAAG